MLRVLRLPASLLSSTRATLTRAIHVHASTHVTKQATARASVGVSARGFSTTRVVRMDNDSGLTCPNCNNPIQKLGGMICAVT